MSDKEDEGGMTELDLGALLGGLAGRRQQPEIRAALKEAAMKLIAPEYTNPKVGDIVVWLDGMITGHIPKNGEECIVTQVLSPPHRCGEPDSTQSAMVHDIALAFQTEDPGVPGTRVIEFLYDSRRFKKVGSIYD